MAEVAAGLAPVLDLAERLAALRSEGADAAEVDTVPARWQQRLELASALQRALQQLEAEWARAGVDARAALAGADPGSPEARLVMLLDRCRRQHHAAAESLRLRRARVSAALDVLTGARSLCYGGQGELQGVAGGGSRGAA
ncbi:MAG TPA: hypothetical protein QF361_06340 [Gammaproteobacteria bacterium]|nr:hypothetical protein [Gammaproteobacteria bacterium]